MKYKGYEIIREMTRTMRTTFTLNEDGSEWVDVIDEEPLDTLYDLYQGDSRAGGLTPMFHTIEDLKQYIDSTEKTQ